MVCRTQHVAGLVDNVTAAQDDVGIRRATGLRRGKRGLSSKRSACSRFGRMDDILGGVRPLRTQTEVLRALGVCSFPSSGALRCAKQPPAKTTSL